jgi:hypothetical protein
MPRRCWRKGVRGQIVTRKPQRIVAAALCGMLGCGMLPGSAGEARAQASVQVASEVGDTAYRQWFRLVEGTEAAWRTRIVAARHGDSSGVRGAAWLWPADPLAAPGPLPPS